MLVFCLFAFFILFFIPLTVASPHSSPILTKSMFELQPKLWRKSLDVHDVESVQQGNFFDSGCQAEKVVSVRLVHILTRILCQLLIHFYALHDHIGIWKFPPTRPTLDCVSYHAFLLQLYPLDHQPSPYHYLPSLLQIRPVHTHSTRGFSSSQPRTSA